MNPRRQLAPTEPADTWEDRAARIIETFESWREAPFDFLRTAAFIDLMTEHCADLRAELAAAGWEAAAS